MSQTWFNKFNFIRVYIYQRYVIKQLKDLDKIQIADSFTTVRKIVNEKASIARFGDGELKLLYGQDTDFQKADKRIVKKLREILVKETPGLLIGLPYPWKHLTPLKYRAIEYWWSYLCANFEYKIYPFLFNRHYYDASFTRFYIDYRSSKHAKRLIPEITKIWDGRNICIIEGEYSRLGVGNNLFNNARSIRRILCPSKNAFSVYDSIIDEATKNPNDTLFLIALGMTATCLAYDLHLLGFQTIDIGHIDVEYEWFLMGAKNKVALPNKNVAESIDNNPVKDIHDEKYLSEIIAVIK